MFFHGTVDLAASKQSVFTSKGAEPERYGPYRCRSFKGLPMGLSLYFRMSNGLADLKPVRIRADLETEISGRG